jgi:hypothetical protein
LEPARLELEQALPVLQGQRSQQLLTPGQLLED